MLAGDHAPWGWMTGSAETTRSSADTRDRFRTRAVLVHPALAGARLEEDTSHVDLPPTILGLLGLDATTDFAGRDVLAGGAPADFVSSQEQARGTGGYVLHNSRVALLRFPDGTCQALDAGTAGKRTCAPEEREQAKNFESAMYAPVLWEVATGERVRSR